MKSVRRTLLLSCLAPVVPGLFAGDLPPAPEAASAKLADKSGYNLFNPAPRELMRDFNTDRPDKTESPYTVDAGHFQIEADIFNYTHDRDTSGGGDTRLDSLGLANINLKVGLFNDVDLQCVIESYRDDRTKDRVTGATDSVSGFGDITFRLKKNFWGNDGGDTAFGVMPFVKAPTASSGLGNDAVEGGVIFPLAIAVADGWGLGLMTEVDFLRNDTDNGYHASYINSITLGYEFTDKLGAYLEFFSEVDERASDWVGTVDVGVTYELAENLRLDAGVNFGVTRAAPDVNVFTGISWRH